MFMMVNIKKKKKKRHNNNNNIKEKITQGKILRVERNSMIEEQFEEP